MTKRIVRDEKQKVVSLILAYSGLSWVEAWKGRCLPNSKIHYWSSISWPQSKDRGKVYNPSYSKVELINYRNGIITFGTICGK